MIFVKKMQLKLLFELLFKLFALGFRLSSLA